MDNLEHRRKFKRVPVRWKTAVVFDKAIDKPILHTQTHDLSVGGTAIHSNYDDLTGSYITLLLDQPILRSGEAPRMLKMRGQVVSSIRSAAMSGFRHGVKFVPSKGDSMTVLVAILGNTEPVRPDAERVAPTHARAAAEERKSPSLVQSSVLAQLRQAALAKRLEEQKPDPKEQMIPRVSTALERAYRYLKEFADLLNQVKPAYAKEYTIVGAPKFDGLQWSDIRLDCQSRELSPATKAFEQVSLNFHLSANKKLSVTRETPADEKLKEVLLETKIEYTAEQEHNARGSVVGTTFSIPCEVRASMRLVGDFDTGKLLLKMRNVEHFGTLAYVVDPEAITEESLNELSQFILGESRHIGKLLLKGA